MTEDLFDHAAAREAKADAMELVEIHADEQWKEDMDRCAIDVASGRPYFTSDDVAKLAIERGQWDNTHEKRALGPVMMRAAKLGICRKANVPPVNSARKSRHAAPLSVWESLICR
jgi:hypothetical protein